MGLYNALSPTRTPIISEFFLQPIKSVRTLWFLCTPLASVQVPFFYSFFFIVRFILTCLLFPAFLRLFFFSFFFFFFFFFLFFFFSFFFFFFFFFFGFLFPLLTWLLRAGKIENARRINISRGATGVCGCVYRLQAKPSGAETRVETIPLGMHRECIHRVSI